MGLVLPLDGLRAATTPKSPDFVAPSLSAVPKGTRVDVIADRLTYDGKSEIATALGTVRLTYGPYVLTASKVVYDMRRGTFSANGSIEFREPNGNVLQADYAELKDTFKEGFARHVKALLTNDVTITAAYARRYENGITIYEHATYTACKTCVIEGGTPLWQIVARETKHDMEEHTLYYRDASLEIGGLPVFWTPYFSYPDPSVKRRSGFLLPSFHGNGTYGFGVTTPYFFAFAPNADLTVSPMWNTRQGVLADVELRHRLRNGIYSIRGYGIHEIEPSGPHEDDPWRGAIETSGSFRINETWNWGWDGTLTSDKKFLNDYDLNDESMATSTLYARGLSDRNYAQAQLIEYRSLENGEKQAHLPVALPYVTANYLFDEPVLGGELQFDMNVYSLHRDDNVYKNNNVANNKFDLGTDQTHAMNRLKWRRETVSPMGLLITPFAELRSDIVMSQNVPTATSQDDADLWILPSAGIDVRWPFFADHGFGQGVLTPVFQVIASPAEQNVDDQGNEDAITLNFDSSSLFLSDRFTGFDRYEGGVRSNAGISYTLMREDGGFIRASLGESFHVAGENSFAVGSGLDGTSSDLVGALAVQLNDHATLGYQARVEEDLSRVNVQEATLGLTFDRISGSLSYADVAKAANYGRPTAEQQVWGNANYKLGEAWSLFGSFRYDIEDDNFMERAIGIGFNCDCMNAQLAFSEERQDSGGYDYRVMLGVELRTIGGVSGGFKL